MSMLITVLFLFIGFPMGVPETDIELRSEATYEGLIASAEYLTMDEKAMLWEINLVRTEPHTYLPLIEQELSNILADSARLSSVISESIHKRVSYVDGQELVEIDTTYKNYFDDRVHAIRELLIELGSAVPLPGLRPYKSLYDAAAKHGSAQAPTAYIDHMGQDGSWPQDRILREAPELSNGNENIARGTGTPREMVIQLLIDSGVAHRGHRKNILDPEWRFVACHHVSVLDESSSRWWIQEFAN